MKKVIFIVIVIILILMISNLASSIWDIWQGRDVVFQAQKSLSLEKQKNQELKSKLSYVQTPEFIEKEARDKLFMSKEGERKVLIPKEEKEQKELKSESENEPNWKKWLALFFN
jgi:cell division protein FtsB